LSCEKKPPTTNQSPKIENSAEILENSNHDADEMMWEGILERMKASVLEQGSVKSAIIVGAGASGLECARQLKARGIEVTILEGRDRIGGRLYTDADGLDIGGHWIHGGGPDKNVPEYSNIGKDNVFDINPVRSLCEEFGIETKLTDGDSCYIGESEAGVREIAFYRSDFSLMENDGEEEEDLWACYEMLMEKVHALEDEMLSEGKTDNGMSLMDAIKKVKAALPKPLTERQERFVQWHLETEYGGDYAEDPDKLSFFYYDGGSAGYYRAFAGGDRILVGGYSVLINKLAEPVMDRVQLNKVVSKVDYSADSGVSIYCADGSNFTADVAVITLPLGILKRTKDQNGYVEFSPELPARKANAIEHGRMACLNKLFLTFDKCYWPEDQYTFSYINEKPDEYPSMIVNLQVSHGVSILTFMVGAGAGRAMEKRKLEVNVAWAMTLVRKLFGAQVPEPIKALQTAWDADPFSYGSYSCMSKGVSADNMIALAEPVHGKLFFAGEHTMPVFWGCVHGAIVSARREVGRITHDFSLLMEGEGKQKTLRSSKSLSKREAKKKKIQGKIQAVQKKSRPVAINVVNAALAMKKNLHE